MTARLVVYGLLRRGGSMNNLLAGAAFVESVVLDGFDMYDLGDFPGVVRGAGELVGEVYELASPALLDVLDEAERVHDVPPLYTRELVDAAGAPAWLYVFARAVDPSRRVASGDWFMR